MEIKDKRFSQLSKALRKYDTHVDSSASFVRKLFNNSVDDYNKSVKNLPKWAKENESFSPFNGLSDDALTRYYNGVNNLSNDLCRKISPFLNENKFQHYFETLNVTDESENDLVNFMKSIHQNTKSDNISVFYCEYFFSLIKEIAVKETHKRGPKKIPEISPFCSADTEADFEERIIKAIKNITYSCDKDFDDKDIYPPYKIREKVKDKHLCDELEVEVQYFPLINSALVEAENNLGKPSEYIRSTVNRHFIRLENQKLSEREIVKRMQQFFATKAAVEFDSPECKTLTVYFIQLCEVFRGSSR